MDSPAVPDNTVRKIRTMRRCAGYSSAAFPSAGGLGVCACGAHTQRLEIPNTDMNGCPLGTPLVVEVSHEVFQVFAEYDREMERQRKEDFSDIFIEGLSLNNRRSQKAKINGVWKIS